MIRKISFLFVALALLWNCRRDVDQVTTDPSVQLSFSKVTVEFDTIFTTVGSTTQQLKVYNNSAEAISISSIVLSGDNQAFFRMIVDGLSGNTAKDIKIAGKDSLFIFIDVTIDPKDANLPFLVTGNIQFVTNGNVQDVALLAYGQQAKFITPNTFPTNGLPAYRIVGKDNQTVTWPVDTPIVIYGYAVIDSTQHLNILPGTQIYIHANSGIWVYRYGKLTVEGNQEMPVVFQGDRLDAYKDISGSWDRIWINDGDATTTSTFNYAIIKNAFIGIQADYKPFHGIQDAWSESGVILDNTVIENSKLAGIYAHNFQILARNTLIKNAGSSNFVSYGGGIYNFNHCTLGNYWRGGARNSPAVYLSHIFFDPARNAYVQDSVIVNFNNCIVYGDQESEFNIEDEIDPGKRINFTMNHTLFKTNIDTVKYGTYNKAIINPSNDNVFIDRYEGDFHLSPASPAKDKGLSTLLTDDLLKKDLDGVVRSLPPDLGTYELQ